MSDLPPADEAAADAAEGREQTAPEATDSLHSDPGLTDAGIADDEASPADEVVGAREVDAEPASPTADPIATVVIVNYNGAHLLTACLDGLAMQRMGQWSFRTVVVDNASADPSRDLLRDSYPDVELLVSHRNRGFAGGNNFALRSVTTKYAVLLNNDAVPEPDWLHNLIAPLESDDTGELVATTSKIVFMPKFVQVSLETPAFRPGGLDPRELGVKIYDVTVDGRSVTDKVLFEQAAYGPEGTAKDRYRWSRPQGQMLVPLPFGAADDDDHVISIEVAAHHSQRVSFVLGATTVAVEAPDHRGETITADLPVSGDVERVDVVNNVGGIVFVNGAGADRGFEEIDKGQYEKAEEVFTACGNGVALRTAKGHAVGWFDEQFFMYYEDVDLSWRLRAAGGRIQYVPDAVLRHIHSASSKPWSANWQFHVERNRLLTLTRNATAPRATKAVGMFVGLTGKMVLRAGSQALRTRRRPPLAHLVVRARVLRSYVQLLPASLRSRREIARFAVVDRARLEKWLVTSR